MINFIETLNQTIVKTTLNNIKVLNNVNYTKNVTEKDNRNHEISQRNEQRKVELLFYCSTCNACSWWL